MKLRRLTPAGIEAFANFLDQLRFGGRIQLPLSLLDGINETEEIEESVEIQQRCNFESRLEMAEYLHEAISKSGIKNVLADKGLWAWLSVFFFESVCPDKGGGLRKPGERARHIPDLRNFRKRYRHLLAGPYMIYQTHMRHPERALSLLCQPVHEPGDIVEQLLSRIELAGNPSIVELATKLYVDPTTRTPKRGSSSRGGGSVRRLAQWCMQMDLTWDLYATDCDTIMEVLPSEFSKFLPA